MRKLILLLTLCWFLSVSFSGCTTVPKEKIVYEGVKANTIVVYDGVTSWEYNLDEWMVVKRETQKTILETLIDKDQQLRECLERERIH